MTDNWETQTQINYGNMYVNATSCFNLESHLRKSTH